MDAGTAVDAVSTGTPDRVPLSANQAREQGRHGRASVFERSTSSRPALGGTSDYELGKSPWDSSRRIWGTNHSLIDDFDADRVRHDPPAPSFAYNNFINQMPTSPTNQIPSANSTHQANGANSIFSSSEHDENTSSTKPPWTSMSTLAGPMSRSKGLPLSPTQQRQNLGPSPHQDSRNTPEPPSLFMGSAPDVDDRSNGDVHSPHRRSSTITSRLIQSPTSAGPFDRNRSAHQPYGVDTKEFGGREAFGVGLASASNGKISMPINYTSQSNMTTPYIHDSYGFGRQPSSQTVKGPDTFASTSSPYGHNNRSHQTAARAEPFASPSGQKLTSVQRSLQALSIDQARQSTEFVPGRRFPPVHADALNGMAHNQGRGQALPEPRYPLIDSAHQPYSSPGPFESQRIESHNLAQYPGMTYGSRGAFSSMSSDQHSNVQSPYYSTSDTPPTGPDSIRSNSANGVPNPASYADQRMLDHKLRSLDPMRYEASPYTIGPLHTHYQGSPYDAASPGFGMRPTTIASPYPGSNYSNGNGYAPTSRMGIRDVDQSSSVCSQLLEDFRMNSKTNKRYELKDIYNHVVEFSGDQHGSRFIQQKLETANSDEKEQVFKEIQPNLLQLMTDVFGNYVIQKLFEHGNQSQKKLLANQMKGHVLHLSMQMYGCRVVQKAFEHVLIDQQASLVKELHGPNLQILKVVKDQNGNHVVQKAIERIPGEHIQFIVDAHRGHVMKMSAHQYGCRVVQRMLEYCQPNAKRMILNELLENIQPLILDSYGNYVVQHIIEGGELQDRRRIVNIVLSNLVNFSKHKFASNIVEKSIECADSDQRMAILRGLTAPDSNGRTPVMDLMSDQYGNYVLQKVHKSLQGAELAALEADMKSHYPMLRKTSYGKQVTAIEKLLFGGPLTPSGTTSSRSSLLPSTNGSMSVSGTVSSLEQLHRK
ncbi:hypothetical protein PV10_05722 [Exophiala mesophila]|uniref:Pumilio homology domain family member 3 n=1 Tax=Exophiala mesophila TaxID=212818 RepID=A0A0D1ZAY9_EXOME|nr:uncharacterized protein PV10_05722 [Exophiala mesophila]KIV91149.1 hypothetical protein PV10_05722 [Exophiala mesophila]